MKKLILSVCVSALSLALFAQNNERSDPKVNQINRLPMHASFFAYESEELARGGDPAASERFLSLNGDWKFAWVRNAGDRPTDFYKTGYNDGHWGVMPVPGVWELNGYGDPVYVNVGYAWENQFKNNPPIVPEENNHVGSYRKYVEIPASWKGQQIIASFGSVISNMYLWVNGSFVGYSEDSRLEAEFDITKYVKPGKNLIAFQIFRWCDGTYIEDQDLWRFAGVGRDCYLYARDKRHIADVRFNASLTDDFTEGLLKFDIEFPPQARGCEVGVRLTDKEGVEIVSHKEKVKGAAASIKVPAGKVGMWSAEEPNLYDLLVTLSDGGRVIEALPFRAGFRNVEIRNSQLLINGRPVLIKGVNRHEMDTKTGYVIGEDRMLQDIRLMKQYNVNAVRTSHYPDDKRWYELCDEYGLYMVAEANIESHGMGYGDKSLAKDAAWKNAHLERNERNVKRNFNHASVIIWSLGNEAGNGPNFHACYDWVKRFDPGRPVQYEQAATRHSDGRSPQDYNSDIQCPMYATYDYCENYVTSDPRRPLIQCEYAHAMGNSMGGFREYWDLTRKYPHYQGGFIWDFVDQSLRLRDRNGVEIYAYGGDFNPYDASDDNFCNDGIVNPDRIPNPHMDEVGYCHQSVWTTDEDARNGKIKVFNEYFFRDISNYRLCWSLICDGRALKSGVVENLDIEPQTEKAIALPFDHSSLPAQGEIFLNVEYRLRNAEPMLPAGFVIARQQIPVRERRFEAPAIANRMTDRHTPAGTIAIRTDDVNFLVAESEKFRIDFRRADGLITRYEADGLAYLEEGFALRPNFWRAPTDNDFGAKLNQKNAVWRNPEMKVVSLDGRLAEGMAAVTVVYDMPSVSAALTIEYTINNAGEILVKQTFSAKGGTNVPDMLRFGMRMTMPQDYRRINYYGRGPIENYADRKASAFVGLYHQDVDEQFYAYIRPQETGTKSDVRWWHQCDLSGRGLKFTSGEPFSASALHYSQESLDDGLEKKQSHSAELPKDSRVWLCIDKLHYGLGCINSWGHLPLPEYRIPYADYTFEFKITPYGKVY